MGYARTMIESDAFGSLVPEIDKKAAKEKGPGRPAYWEMIFWWTRKPLISARAFTAASLLPENYPLDKYRKMVRLSDDVPHKYQPITDNEFRNITVLDPFAGFGSIPLEAKRLRVGKVIASDLLPIAYVFLKAVLEYPKYGERLLNDVKKYGQELIKSIENDVKELYGEYSGFVGTWEVKCPHCGNYTPLVYQWWLSVMKGIEVETEVEESGEEVKTGKFKRIAFMKPEIINGRLRISIIDLNKELDKKIINAKVSKDKVIVDGKEYRVPEGNVGARRNYAKCLYCNTALPGKGDKWYVREALRDWNEKYEKYLNGEITLQELQNAKARPALLVKFKEREKGRYLEFEEISERDIEEFWNHFEKLKEVDLMNIPIEEVAPYGTVRAVTWGFDKFYKFFDARQLIIFSKIVTKLNEFKEKIDGDDDYKNAVITYLILMFLNHVRHNNLFTLIKVRGFTFFADALGFRTFAPTWNWVDISPLIDATGSLAKSLDRLIEGLEYLIQTNSDSKVEIMNNDVNELTLSDKVDVIITDPPYADDVPYPEISDFYYVWLKRVIPFPYKTQWEAFAIKDVGFDEYRSKGFDKSAGTYEHFRNQLARAFSRLAGILKDDGLLVTFFTHPSPDAWVSLLYAGWYVSKFKITATHAVTTEDEFRPFAKAGIVSLDKSIVITWRKKAEGSKLVHEVMKEAITKVSDWIASTLAKQKLETSTDIYMEVLGKILSVFTRYEKILGLRGEGITAVEDLVIDYVFPATAQAIIEGLSKGAGVRISDPYATFYVLTKLLIPPSKGMRKLYSNALSYLRVSSDKIDIKDLQNKGIVRVEASNAIILVEPERNRSVITSLEQLPEVQMVLRGDYNFSNPVQVFHYLEYIVMKHPDKVKVEIERLRGLTRFVDEALAIAKILVRVLPDDDIEKEPSRRLVGERIGIEKWFG